MAMTRSNVLLTPILGPEDMPPRQGGTRARRFLERLLGSILWRLTRCGIHMSIILMTQENAQGTQTSDLPADLEVSELTPTDIDDLLALQPDVTREQFIAEFDAGRLCFGLRHHGVLVGKVWCDLHAVNEPAIYRPLGPDEAYLFAAYTAPAFRGRNIAPALRTACYRALRARGKTLIWSFSNYHNGAARQFKKKLGAIEGPVQIHVDLFRRWSIRCTLAKRSPRKTS